MVPLAAGLFLIKRPAPSGVWQGGQPLFSIVLLRKGSRGLTRQVLLLFRGPQTCSMSSLLRMRCLDPPSFLAISFVPSGHAYPQGKWPKCLLFIKCLLICKSDRSRTCWFILQKSTNARAEPSGGNQGPRAPARSPAGGRDSRREPCSVCVSMALGQSPE